MTNRNTHTPDTLHKHLCDTSSTGRVRPWRKHKVTSRAVAASMMRIWSRHKRKNAQFRKRAALMAKCGDYLAFGQHVDTETGEVTRRLDAANFCRDRLCPMCQWRKSLVTFSQLSAIMDRIDAERPGLVPVFLTLTMRNVASDGLADGVTHILKAWGTLTAKRTNPQFNAIMAGWFRALEITYNAKDRTWHPHIHAVLLMPPEYFTDPALYRDHAAWVAEWRKALRADYDPVVDIRTIKNDRAKAVAEVSKYAVKPGEWISDDECVTDANVELLATVLRGRRLVAFGGLMMQARKALKQVDAEKADLVNTDSAEDVMRADVRVALERYEWQAGVTNDYMLVEVTDMREGV